MVDAIDVVVGDLLLLEAGDRIPADGLIVRAAALQLDTSLLTGESETVRAESGDEVHAGTFVVEGEAQAVVRATGASTRLADIARLTTGTPPPASPLTVELGPCGAHHRLDRRRGGRDRSSRSASSSASRCRRGSCSASG